MTAWTLNLRKPVKTLRLTSATPSPSVSLKYHTSGVAQTNTPPLYGVTPVGQLSPSAKMVDLSNTPSPSVSTSRRTLPIGASVVFSFHAWWVLGSVYG